MPRPVTLADNARESGLLLVSCRCGHRGKPGRRCSIMRPALSAVLAS